MSTHRIGIEVTPRRAEAAILAPDGQLVSRDHANGRGLLDLIRLVENSTGLAGVLNVGIAVDADFAREDLERQLGRPIRLAPSAACLALSEGSDGSAVADEIVFGAILGPSATGGLCVRGRVRAAPHPLGPSLSSKGLGDELGITVPEVMLRLRFGEPKATELFERYLRRLVVALVEITHTYNPDAIVLGGSIGRQDDLYPPLSAALKRALHRASIQPSVHKAVHGETAVLRGAAALWPVNA